MEQKNNPTHPFTGKKKALDLGTVLIEMGKITSDQINEALQIQKQNGEKLGEILVKLGYCTEVDIANAMARKFGYSAVSLNEIGIDIAAVSLITPEEAQKYQLLPIRKDGRTLLVAMKNPDDIVAIDDLQILTGYSVKPVIVSDSDLRDAIQNYVNASNNITVSDEDMVSADAPTDLAAVPDDIDDKPAVNFVNQMIDSAVRAGASDIHIEPQEKYLRIRFRIDGVLHEVMQQPVKMQAAILSRIKIMGSMDIAERRIPLDGRATVRVDDRIIDIRIASLPGVYGEKITMRLLVRNSTNITLEQLGYNPYNYALIQRMISKPYGFVLVTGPTGSGKSTTLYAILQQLNTEDRNIITLEDPVERRFSGVNQIQLNNRAGMTFESGLRSILRSDPDIIMIGEIRDKETAKIAVESALTGHFVMSTLHTNDAASAVTRLDEMGVESFLVASSVIGVMAQRLMRVLCPKCKEAVHYKRRDLEQLIPDFPFDEGCGPDDDVVLYKPVGCISCNNTGYRGRMGVHEVMEITPEIIELILAHKSADEIKKVALRQGMYTLRADGLLKVKEGKTSYEEMIRVVV